MGARGPWATGALWSLRVLRSGPDPTHQWANYSVHFRFSGVGAAFLGSFPVHAVARCSLYFLL